MRSSLVEAFFAVIALAASVSADCQLAGTYNGTSILTKIGRAAVQSCTRPGGPGTPLLDADGNPCSRAVCRDQEIIFGANGESCDKLNIFQPGCGAPVLKASCNNGLESESKTTFTCTVQDTSFSIPVKATLTDGKNLQWDLGEDGLLGSISAVRQCSLVGSYSGSSSLTLLGRASTGGCFLDDTGALVNRSGFSCLPANCGPSMPFTISATTDNCDSLTITLDPFMCPGAPPASASCLDPTIDETGIEKFTCRVSPGVLDIPVKAVLNQNYISWKLSDGVIGEINGVRAPATILTPETTSPSVSPTKSPSGSPSVSPTQSPLRSEPGINLFQELSLSNEEFQTEQTVCNPPLDGLSSLSNGQCKIRSSVQGAVINRNQNLVLRASGTISIQNRFCPGSYNRLSSVEINDPNLFYSIICYRRNGSPQGCFLRTCPKSTTLTGQRTAIFGTGVTGNNFDFVNTQATFFIRDT